MAIVLPGAWVFAASSMVIGIYGGGPAVEIWGTLAVGAALCSYFTGSFESITVAFIPPVLILVLSELTFTCACLFHQDYVPKRWQIWLLFQLFNVIYLFGIKYMTTIIGELNRVGIMVLFTGLIVTIGVMVGMSNGDRPPNAFLWTSFENGSGYSSPVMGALLGLLGPLYAYGPPHWMLNLADEVENPKRSIPIALLVGQIGNITTLFAFYVAVYYCIDDYNSLLDTTFPSLVGQLYLQGTKSPIAALFLLLLVIAPSLFGTYGTFVFQLISANIRLLWGYSRSGSLPYQRFWMKVDIKHNIPVNVLYVSIAVNFLMSFVYLGSEVGFNIIIDSANFFYNLGFLPLLAASLLTRRRYLEAAPKSYFRMSYTVGTCCEVLSFLFNAGCVVVESFPGSYPVTAENMNYTIVFGAAGILATTLGWIFHGRKHYLIEGLDGVDEEVEQPTEVVISPKEQEAVDEEK
ncbi:amino acid permease-domain-containing protein [Exophiala viscosa]|uniref:amino acid permease-domain-containing protein n=1 Tax=Exophiala viscosa TaxID=2486360 RepID=UPI00219F0E1E|nr:amino acid permease-domain-containing protein [Exophiala viscosa]